MANSSRKGKKRMGRPPLANPKRVLAALRITEKEKAELTRAAKKSGVSLSTFIMAPHRRTKKG